jgi:hypothetical protein
MKRLIAFGVIVSLLLVGAPSLAAPLSGTFLDDDGNVHEPNIEAIAMEGITRGCAADRYCPTAPVRRDEMASFLARALELSPLTSGPFTDIAGNPHLGAINAIAAAGITLGCASDRYCPAAAVRRDEMASFLARAFALAPQPSPFSDTTGNVHETNIGGIAAAGITLGCSASQYCPDRPVLRDQMASFLARALGLEPVYVLLGMARGLPLGCTKDGLVCTGNFTVPHRPAYRVSEGFYHVLPFAGGEQLAFTTPTTRFELLVNGAVQPLASVTKEGASSTERRYEGQISLAPGTHQVIGRWFWHGSLVQTTVLNLNVAG